MKEIKLSQTNCKNRHLNLVALVDDDDYDYLMQWKWYANKHRNTFYAKRFDPDGNIRMHRQLLNISDPKITIDHKDHNGLNNQRDNLRVCNSAQNAWNKSVRPGGTSLYKGVSFHKKMGKYMAAIRRGGSGYYLGYFESQEDAAIAYNKKAVELFGEFAHLNTIVQ